MKVQYWGTYSVRDHRRTRPFVADVLLFDKLVIPRPASDEELYFDEGVKPAVDQKQRWRDAGWDPDAQRQSLDILKEFDLAIELPWGGRAQYDWKRVYDNPAEELQCDRSELARSIKDQVEMAKSGIPQEAAYITTASVLAMYVASKMNNDVARKLFAGAKIPGVDVEPVIAYGSYGDFQKDQGLLESPDMPPVETSLPYAMFGWEFFIPEDSDKTDAKLLREAAKLASRPDLCETRQYFYGWLKQMYEGKVDRQDAHQKMKKMLTEYSSIVRKSGMLTTARYAAKVAQVLAPLAGLVGHAAGVETGVAVAGAAMMVDQLIPMPQVPDRLRSAALLHDARNFFEKH